MLTGLRRRVRLILSGAEASRPPALRRALGDDAIFACDLPLCAPEAETVRIAALLEKEGWRVRRRDGWLLLDCPLPPLPLPEGLEAAACASLLRRHPAGAPEPVWQRRLAKAMETGGTEQACRELHRELAVRLREKKPLPGGLFDLKGAPRDGDFDHPEG